MNRELLTTGFKLCLICAVAAVSLGALNEITEPQILFRRIQEEKQTLDVLVPDAEVGEKVFVEQGGAVKAHFDVDKQGSHFGYILDLRGLGYGGDMKILAAYKNTGELVSARLLDNLETPGLGKKAESVQYMDQFKGTGTAETPMPVSKEMLQARNPAPEGTASKRLSFKTWFLGAEAGGSADAISGATITFLGVATALAEGAEFVRNELGGR
jgi:electron transport complex protein RnfG